MTAPGTVSTPPPAERIAAVFAAHLRAARAARRVGLLAEHRPGLTADSRCIPTVCLMLPNEQLIGIASCLDMIDAIEHFTQPRTSIAARRVARCGFALSVADQLSAPLFGQCLRAVQDMHDLSFAEQSQQLISEILNVYA